MYRIVPEFPLYRTVMILLGKLPKEGYSRIKEEALLCAVTHGHILFSQQLINKGANPKARDKEGNTALMLASQSQQNSAGLIDLLVKAGAHMEAQNNSAQTALGLAATSGHLLAVEKLLALGAKMLNAASISSLPQGNAVKTAIEGYRFKAEALKGAFNAISCGLIQTGSLSIPALLLNYEDETTRETPLAIAIQGSTKLEDKSVQQNPVAYVWQVLSSSPAEYYPKLHQDAVVLLYTTFHSEPNVLSKYMPFPGSLEARAANGETALMRVVRSGQANAVKALLQAGADLHAQNNDGDTPLILAARMGHRDIVESDSTGNRTSNRNSTTRLEKQQSWKPRLLVILRYFSSCHNEAGFNAWWTENRETALILAAMQGRKSTVEYLVKLGVALEERDRIGETALTKAMQNGHLEIVQFLLGQGARIQSKNSHGDIAFFKDLKNSAMQAVIERHRSSVQPLFQAIEDGAAVSWQDFKSEMLNFSDPDTGDTPLVAAIKAHAQFAANPEIDCELNKRELL